MKLLSAEFIKSSVSPEQFPAEKVAARKAASDEKVQAIRAAKAAPTAAPQAKPTKAPAKAAKAAPAKPVAMAEKTADAAPVATRCPGRVRKKAEKPAGETA